MKIIFVKSWLRLLKKKYLSTFQNSVRKTLNLLLLVLYFQVVDLYFVMQRIIPDLYCFLNILLNVDCSRASLKDNSVHSCLDKIPC